MKFSCWRKGAMGVNKVDIYVEGPLKQCGSFTCSWSDYYIMDGKGKEPARPNTVFKVFNATVDNVKQRCLNSRCDFNPDTGGEAAWRRGRDDEDPTPLTTLYEIGNLEGTVNWKELLNDAPSRRNIWFWCIEEKVDILLDMPAPPDQQARGYWSEKNNWKAMYDYLHKERNMYQTCKKMAEAVEILEKKKLIIQDLKPENIGISKGRSEGNDFAIKFFDLDGLHVATNGGIGKILTPAYSSPVIIIDEIMYRWKISIRDAQIGRLLDKWKRLPVFKYNFEKIVIILDKTIRKLDSFYQGGKLDDNVKNGFINDIRRHYASDIITDSGIDELYNKLLIWPKSPDFINDTSWNARHSFKHDKWGLFGHQEMF